MAIIALAISVILTAALAVVVVVSGRHFTARVNTLYDILADAEKRYAIPEELKSEYSAVLPSSETDITGEWASEQQRRGIEVTDEEIDEQRRLWAAEGA